MPAPHTAIIARAIVRDGDAILTVRMKGQEWSFLPGGHVEPGEPVELALAREFVEELAAEVTITGFAGVVEHGYVPDDGVERHEINFVFDAYLADTRVTSQEDELEFAWLPLSELPDHDLRPSALKDVLLNRADTTPFWRPSRPAPLADPRTRL